MNLLEKSYHLYIDAIKGYGILLVMVMHAIGGFPDINLYLYSGYMPMFFVCAGYTTNLRTNSFRDFVKNKTKRLLKPYFFYAIFFNLLFSVKYLITGNIPDIIKYEWIGIIYSRYCLYPIEENQNIIFLSLKNTSPLWFLTAMFLAYIWTYLFIIQKNRYKHFIIYIYILLSFCLYKLHILLPWSLDTSFIAALFIISGLYLRKIKLSLFNIFILSIIFVVLVNFNGWTNMSINKLGIHGYFSIILFYIIGIIQTLIITYIFYHTEHLFITKLFAFIGKHSLTLMCIHMPLFTIFYKFIDYPDINHYIRVALNICIVISISIFIDKYSTLKKHITNMSKNVRLL